MTPSQFMMTKSEPAFKIKVQPISGLQGAACEILRDRQDIEGVANLQEGFKRQEALVLERQAVEEIYQPNITLFNSTQTGNNSGGSWGIGQGF